MQLSNFVQSILELATAHYEPDKEVKEKKYVTLNNETSPFYLDKLDSLVKENNGYFALGRVNWTNFSIV